MKLFPTMTDLSQLSESVLLVQIEQALSVSCASTIDILGTRHACLDLGQADYNVSPSVVMHERLRCVHLDDYILFVLLP